MTEQKKLGAPFKYGEDTVSVTFGAPQSLIETIDAQAKALGVSRSKCIIDSLRALIQP